MSAPQPSAYEALGLSGTATAKEAWQAFQVNAAILPPDRRFELAARLYGKEAAADVAEEEAAAYGYYWHKGGRMTPLEWKWMTWLVVQMQVVELKIVSWQIGIPKAEKEILPAPKKRACKPGIWSGLKHRYWKYNESRCCLKRKSVFC